MSSAQIVSASVLQNKLSPPPPLPQAVFSAAPRVRNSPRAPRWGHPGWWEHRELHTGQGDVQQPFSAVGAMQGPCCLQQVRREMLGVGESEVTDSSLCCFPSFGVGLSQDSLDPLRSKYRPLHTRHQQDPTLARGWGIPGLVT